MVSRAEAESIVEAHCRHLAGQLLTDWREWRASRGWRARETAMDLASIVLSPVSHRVPASFELKSPRIVIGSGVRGREHE
jgi:hypothetical protein